MTRPERHAIQSAVLDAARTAGDDGRPTDRELADVMACDRSEVTRFGAGERRMDLDEVIALADRYGVDVLAPVVALIGGRIVPADVIADHGDPLSMTFDGSAHLVELQRTVARAQQDNRIDPGEAADIHRQVEQLTRQLRRVLSTVAARTGRRSG